MLLITNSNQISPVQKNFLDWHFNVLGPQTKNIDANIEVPFNVLSLLHSKSSDYRFLLQLTNPSSRKGFSNKIEIAFLRQIGSSIQSPEELGYDVSDFTYVYGYNEDEAEEDYFESGIIEKRHRPVKRNIDNLDFDTKSILLDYCVLWKKLFIDLKRCPHDFLEPNKKLLMKFISKKQKKLDHFIDRL